MSVTHQLAPLLVPKAEGKRFQTGEQRDRFHVAKQRLGFVAFLKVIVGNPRAQMMDVMESDVP